MLQCPLNSCREFVGIFSDYDKCIGKTGLVSCLQRAIVVWTDWVILLPNGKWYFQQADHCARQREEFLPGHWRYRLNSLTWNLEVQAALMCLKWVCTIVAHSVATRRVMPTCKLDPPLLSHACLLFSNYFPHSLPFSFHPLVSSFFIYAWLWDWLKARYCQGYHKSSD
jgi:hypothetical protein